MINQGEVKDMLVLAFLKDGLSMRNHELVDQQKKVAMALLARRNDIIARKRAYRAFIQLEKGITDNYRDPAYKYMQSAHQGRTFLAQRSAELEYGRRHPRVAQKVFHYLKSRMIKGRTRS